MEHSYVGNNFVNTFATLINDEEGKYKGYPMVWCGDYADDVLEGKNYYDIARDNNTDEDVKDLKVMSTDTLSIRQRRSLSTLRIVQVVKQVMI